MSHVNRQILLASRPTGEPVAENFKLVETPVAPLVDGQVLVRHHFLSLDPYMRGRMSDAKSYAAPQPLNEVMIGGTAGEVVESKSPHFKAGDQVVGMGGWQEYAVVDAGQRGVLQKVDTTHVPLSAYLGAVGMPGVTGWYGLVKIIAPKAGETVVVSSAAGAVGGAVGQLAKVRGCRVVGIAGGPDKCRLLLEEFGFDAALDYKSDDLRAGLRQHAPDGVDVYFDNVGGDVLDAVLTRLARGARIVICGAVSQYNAQQVRGPANYLSLLVSRASMTGMLVFDYYDRFGPATAELAQWYGEGRLVAREHIVHGSVTDFPEVLLMLFTGENTGKLILATGAG